MATVTEPFEREIPVHRITVDQYQQMIAHGILDRDDRVELLEGLLVEKIPHSPRHEAAIDYTQEQIRAILPSAWRLREQKAIELDDSQPEPDLAVVRGPVTRYARRHPRPSDIALLIEVADATLLADRRFKGRLYARNRIPLYWIINLRDDLLEVYSELRGGKNPGYKNCKRLGAKEEIALILDGRLLGRLKVRELIP